MPTLTALERQFRSLLDHEKRMRHAYELRLHRAKGPCVVTRDDQPDFLLAELSFRAHQQFAVVMHLLRHPRLAYGAEEHIRGLVEYVGYVGFVLGKETPNPVGSSAQRATCLSVARSRERLEALVNPFDKRASSPQKVKAEQTVLDGYEELHLKLGCPWGAVKMWPCRDDMGQPCEHRGAWPCRRVDRPMAQVVVAGTLKGLARLIPRLQWMPDLHKSASIVSHYSMPERFLVARPDGLGGETDATFKQRALWYVAASTLYAHALGWTLEYHSASAAGSFQRWGRRPTRHANVFEEAIAGKLDL